VSRATKTIIGALASHDDPTNNERMVEVLDELHCVFHSRSWWEDFAFAFTGGTYDRVICGRTGGKHVKLETAEWLHEACGVLRLPEKTCGVTLLAYLVSKGLVRVVWPLLTPLTTHWLCSENLALLRLCALHNATSFMNPINLGVG